MGNTMTFTELELVLMISVAVLVTLYFNLRTEYLHFKLQTSRLIRAIAERKATVHLDGDGVSIKPTRS